MQKIRVFIGMLGMDQHEMGAIAVSRLLRDAGMEVIYAGRFNTPAMIVKTSIEENIDVVGVSCHSWEYIHYIPELFQLMSENGVDIPLVVGGSIITPGDVKDLMKKGVSAVFGPSSTDAQIIETIKKIVNK
jgi:methylmalonyl-CoA mutase C-terminal domain/subunit